ncbi:hypothetical protein C7C46_08230, partial [Streptomyces tateyamensis]
VRDRRTGSTVRVSLTSDGGQAVNGAFFPSISADGSRVVFVSRDRGLGLQPRLARFYPLFSHDLRT